MSGWKYRLALIIRLRVLDEPHVHRGNDLRFRFPKMPLHRNTACTVHAVSGVVFPAALIPASPGTLPGVSAAGDSSEREVKDRQL